MKRPKIIAFILFISISFLTNAQDLDHSTWDQLLSKNVSTEGKVNYKGFMNASSQFNDYLTYLSNNPPASSWSSQKIKSYWINVYNAYTIKLIIDNYPTKSIKDIKDPWGQEFFKINNIPYSLNDVEHKTLRKLGDPRIHFAINCASFSCPIVWNKAFTANNVEDALEKLTINFINDPERNKITKDVVEISKIFSWFKKDFKINGGDTTTFINKYSKIKIDNQSKGFKKYNWSLNE